MKTLKKANQDKNFVFLFLSKNGWIPLNYTDAITLASRGEWMLILHPPPSSNVLTALREKGGGERHPEHATFSSSRKNYFIFKSKDS